MNSKVDPEYVGESEADRVEFHLDYLSEVVRLRLAQETNGIDAEITTPRKNRSASQITYIFDSNIFYFFMRTWQRNEYQKANPLQGLTEHWLKHAPNANMAKYIAPAVVTARYLFSGKLPGQRGYPVYFAPEHQEEFQGRISGLFDDIRSHARRLTPEEKIDLGAESARIKDTLQELRADKKGEQIVSRVRRVLDVDIPAMIRKFDLEKVDEAMHLIHLVEGDVARPLRLAPGVNRCLVDDTPDPVLVGEWRARLENYNSREIYRRPSGNDPENRSLNTLADARVLARLEVMNRSAERNGNRFVLVTTSQAVLSANAYWLHEKELDMTEGLVRPLQQYVPILNIRDMENFSKQTVATSSLRAAIDSLFLFRSTFVPWAKFFKFIDIFLRDSTRVVRTDNLNKRMQTALKALERERLSSFFSRLNPEKYHDALLQIPKEWNRLVTNTVGLNIRTLIDHYQNHLEQLSIGIDSLTSDPSISAELGTSYVREQFGTAERIALVNLRLSTNHMLGQAASARRRLAEVAGAARPHVYLKDEDVRAIQDIFRCIRDKEIEAVEPRILAFVEQSERGVVRTALSVATIALQMGFWANASAFARIARVLSADAIRLTTSETEVQQLEAMKIEALWITGTARRVSLVSQDDQEGPAVDRRDIRAAHRKAVLRHEEAVKLSKKLNDFVARARSEAELAHLETLLLLTDERPKDEELKELRNRVERASSQALFYANGILTDLNKREKDRTAIRRTRLLAGVTMIMFRLDAIGRDTLPESDDIRHVIRDVEEDIEALGRDKFDAWPMMLEILRQHLGEGSADQRSLLKKQKILEVKARQGECIATEPELALMSAAIKKLSEV